MRAFSVEESGMIPLLRISPIRRFPAENPPRSDSPRMSMLYVTMVGWTDEALVLSMLKISQASSISPRAMCAPMRTVYVTTVGRTRTRCMCPISSFASFNRPALQRPWTIVVYPSAEARTGNGHTVFHRDRILTTTSSSPLTMTMGTGHTSLRPVSTSPALTLASRREFSVMVSGRQEGLPLHAISSPSIIAPVRSPAWA
mmetsp:Transcript_59737/g.81654  ORF Transcript_59737/g.81654 Transcript_59737/m.81654 type:complete len:200 (+) Transcript_59737:1278-1877(+)